MTKKTIRCAVIGYGTVANFGKAHAFWINGTDGLELAAICDIDSERTKVAKEDYPEIETYNNLDTMLSEGNIDMVSVVTPNNTHASLALKCLGAGKHVIVEKPMCIKTVDATAMIEEAKKANVMLSVFQDRRYDGNYLAIQEVINAGLIGDVFQIEFTAGGYGYAAETWRQNKEISGGLFYCDIIPHATDWALNLVKSDMMSITGFSHTFPDRKATNEDQMRAIVLFENGTVADITRSHISYMRKPQWRILGTKGAIIDTAKGAIKGYPYNMVGPSGGSFTLIVEENGKIVESEVPYKESQWGMFYSGVTQHLLLGKPVPVTGEEGRRTVVIMETAGKSAGSGHTEPVPHK